MQAPPPEVGGSSARTPTQTLPCAVDSLVESACQGTQEAAAVQTIRKRVKVVVVEDDEGAANEKASSEAASPAVGRTAGAQCPADEWAASGFAEGLLPSVAGPGTQCSRDGIEFMGIPLVTEKQQSVHPEDTASSGLITHEQLVGEQDEEGLRTYMIGGAPSFDVWECGLYMLELAFLRMVRGEIPFPDSVSPVKPAPSVDAALLYYQQLRGRDPFGLQLGRLLTFRGAAGSTAAKPVQVMLDSGCSAVIVKPQLVAQLGLTTRKVASYNCKLANGTKVAITHLAQVPLTIGTYSEELTCAVAPIDGFDVILGKSWLDKYEPQVRWRKGLVQFRQAGRRHRLRAYVPAVPAAEPLDCEILITGTQVVRMQRQGEVDSMFWLYPSDFAGPVDSVTVATLQADAEQAQGPPSELLSELAVPQGMDERQVEIAPQAAEAYLTQYADRLVDSVPSLPPHRGDMDFEFDLIPGAEPPHAKPYRLSAVEIAELRKQLAELEAKGFIYPCHSPYSSPVLFVRKKPLPIPQAAVGSDGAVPYWQGKFGVGPQSGFPGRFGVSIQPFPADSGESNLQWQDPRESL